MADTPRPDPASDMVGALRWTMAALAELLERDGAKRVTGAQMAREEGRGRDYYQRPWRVPGFGPQGRSWPRRTWRAWNTERTDAERREAWDALPLSERRRARGRSAA